MKLELFKQSILHLWKQRSLVILLSILLLTCILYYFVVPIVFPGSNGLVDYYESSSWFSDILPFTFIVLSLVAYLIANKTIDDGFKINYLSKAICRQTFFFIKFLVAICVDIFFLLCICILFVIIHFIVLARGTTISFLTKDVNPAGLFFGFFFISSFAIAIVFIFSTSKLNNIFVFLIVIAFIALYVFVSLNWFTIGSNGTQNNHNYWFSSIMPNIIFLPLSLIAILIGLIKIRNGVINE